MLIPFSRAAALAVALLPCLATAAPLSLEAALQLAGQRSESARAARASVLSATEASRSAARLPDPTLRVGVDNLPATGADRFHTAREPMTMKRIGISQEWLSADKRAARQAAADAAIDPFNYTDEEVDVLQQLSKRRAELDAKARELDEREALVTAAEQRMDQKMAELKAMQSTLQDLLKKRSDAEETQLQSLVKIYENMKPKAAAGVFEELDMDILLEVVARMKERKVAPILAMMTPTKAKELTFELAQRQQLPVAP